MGNGGGGLSHWLFIAQPVSPMKLAGWHHIGGVGNQTPIEIDWNGKNKFG